MERGGGGADNEGPRPNAPASTWLLHPPGSPAGARPGLGGAGGGGEEERGEGRGDHPPVRWRGGGFWIRGIDWEAGGESHARPYRTRVATTRSLREEAGARPRVPCQLSTEDIRCLHGPPSRPAGLSWPWSQAEQVLPRLPVRLPCGRGSSRNPRLRGNLPVLEEPRSSAALLRLDTWGSGPGRL